MESFALRVFLLSCAISICGANLGGLPRIACPATCTCLGTNVDCSSRKLSEIPKTLPTWATTLDLRDNQLSGVVPNGAFRSLKMLRALDMSENSVSGVAEDALPPGLKRLVLSKNQFREIPFLKKGANVTELVLQHNRIRSWNPRALEVLPNLKTLDLSHNKLARFPKKAFAPNNSLTQLILNHNKIASIEKGSLDNLTRLELLKLSKNKISSLPKNIFKKSGALKVLDLSRNRIRVLDGLIFHGLENVEVLKLKRNHISTLMDGCFWGLEKIQYLQMDYNNVSSIAKEWLYGLSNLNQLTLSANRISRIDPQGWSFTQGLMDLDLAQNEIDKINTDTFHKLSSLQNLYLDNNEISSIENQAFSELHNLQVLELQGNRISWTLEDMNGPFLGLENLIHLGLKSNEIKTISKDSFLGLSSLRHLDLSDNQISSIQYNAFEDMTELLKLRLNSSNLLCDCHLNWFPRYVQEKRFEKNVVGSCIHPEPLKGRSILEVPQDEFKCDDFPKPIIRSEPKDKIALRGENHTLECTAASSSSAPMNYQWKKNDAPMESVEVEHFVTASKDESVTIFTTRLRLFHIRDSDAGIYQCVISNQFGASYSKRAAIHVYTLPIFIKTPVHVTVYPGSTARFECAADGSPKPEVAWQKDGGDDFPAARERRMHVMASDVFFITNAKLDDEGVYTCKATNAAGVVYTNASLSLVRVKEVSTSPKNGVTTTPRGGSNSPTIDPLTTTGIVVIAVVCCVICTSLVWVCVIYQSRRKKEECSTSGTEETSVSDSGNGGSRFHIPSSRSVASLSHCQYGVPPIYSALGLEQYQAMVPTCHLNPQRPFTYPWVVIPAEGKTKPYPASALASGPPQIAKRDAYAYTQQRLPPRSLVDAYLERPRAVEEEETDSARNSAPGADSNLSPNDFQSLQVAAGGNPQIRGHWGRGDSRTEAAGSEEDAATPLLFGKPPEGSSILQQQLAPSNYKQSGQEPRQCSVDRSPLRDPRENRELLQNFIPSNASSEGARGARPPQYNDDLSSSISNVRVQCDEDDEETDSPRSSSAKQTLSSDRDATPTTSSRSRSPDGEEGDCKPCLSKSFSDSVDRDLTPSSFFNNNNNNHLPVTSFPPAPNL